MKKSNIILLAGFLAVILMISAIHITLYAKYKAGNFTIYSTQDDLAFRPVQSFPNILFVSVRNVPHATVKFSDTAQIEKGEEAALEYVQKGDTLWITAKENAKQEDFPHSVTFNLPYSVTLSMFNSSLSFKAGNKNTSGNPVIYLNKSTAAFSGVGKKLQLGHVKVVASDSSAALFQANTHVNHLEVQLAKSVIEFAEGDFGQLSIITDSVSRISLQSKHLLKANIKTSDPQ